MSIGIETRRQRKEQKEYRCFAKSQKKKRGGKIKTFKGMGMNDFRAYQEKLARGTMVKEARKVKGCAVPGCQMKHHAKGLCSRHYRQVRRNGKVNGD
jgi:hypothetical protein